MILLTGTSDLIRVVTDAAGDIESHASWVDKTQASAPYNFAGGRTNTASITTATTTTIVGSPAASTERSVRHLSLYNNHASQAVTCRIEHTDGSTVEILKNVILAAGESLALDAAGVWTHYDPNGNPYVGVGPIATQAEMEAGASLTTVVTPGRAHLHPSAAKCWVEALANSTTVLASYNVTSLTDTATGTMTVTIATDFSSANWACVVSRAEDDLTLVYSSTYNAKAAGSVAINSVVEAGGGSDPTSSSGNASWSMAGFGDL